MFNINICDVGVVQVKTTNNSGSAKNDDESKQSDRKESTDTESTLRN